VGGGGLGMYIQALRFPGNVTVLHSAHILNIGHILGRIFPHTDILESSVFFLLLREHHRDENFSIPLAFLFYEGFI
jgi:hypothetical protein